jgi:hypothetical protein
MGERNTYWTDDDAAMGDAFPPRNVLEWDSGTIIWDIPVAWDLTKQAGEDYFKRIPVVYKQRFDFNSSGTLRVSKHGHWVERDADGHKRKSKGITLWMSPEP